MLNYNPKPIPFIISRSSTWIICFLIPLVLLITLASNTSIISWIVKQHLEILFFSILAYCIIAINLAVYSYRHYRISIDQELQEFNIQRKLPGITFSDTLSFNKIASIKISSTPIDHLNKTASLHLLSESAVSASLTLPNLPIKDIDRLKEIITSSHQS